MVSRISSKNVQGRYRNFYVKVPTDWAERMEARGVRRVEISDVGDKGVLVLSPITEARFDEMRGERRRAARRKRYAVR